MFFDSHCHLLLIKEKQSDIELIMKRAIEKNIHYLIDVSVGLEDFFKRISLIRYITGIFDIKIAASAGIPPYFADKRRKNDLQELEIQIDKGNNIVAVGEIGLDYFYNYGTHEQQISLFREQIEIANQFGLPVIIHTRDADADLIKTLKENKPKKGGVIHCFSSDFNTAKKLIDLGFSISFAGNVTYKKSQNIQEAAARIPIQKMLIETDSPYLAPQRYRGKPNEPSFIVETAEFISKLRGTDVDNIARETTANAKKLFGL